MLKEDRLRCYKAKEEYFKAIEVSSTAVTKKEIKELKNKFEKHCSSNNHSSIKLS